MAAHIHSRPMNRKLDKHDMSRSGPRSEPQNAQRPESDMLVSLLTGAADKHYAFGLAMGLLSNGVALDLIGGEGHDYPQMRGNAKVNFLNLRGNQSSDSSLLTKSFRVLAYYAQLIWYVPSARPRIFHILWNNKFQTFDRTLLMIYYKLFGKKVLLTVHNVNAGVRDFSDTQLNRLTLRIQYHLADHLFVHTEKMKSDLTTDFGVPATRITVIPFGVNNAVKNTSLTPAEARHRLGLGKHEKVLLFFGYITPYKGLEYLTAAFKDILTRHNDYRLVIAGKPKDCERYWGGIRGEIIDDVRAGRVLICANYIPDEETEVYFKAADLLVLPYRYIYQSAVLFLGYSFGLPVVATDVGSLTEDILEGETGFSCRPEDAGDLARTIERYFSSDLYRDLDSCRATIRDYALERHSWANVSAATLNIYAGLLGSSSTMGSAKTDPARSG